MKAKDIKAGQVFRFGAPGSEPWEYRGNGWYGRPYSGGPYCMDEYQRNTTPVRVDPDCIGFCRYCGEPRYEPMDPCCTDERADAGYENAETVTATGRKSPHYS